MRVANAVERLGYDTRHALRGMRRRPAFTAMVAGTLALGIGATVTMFGALDKLLLQPPALVVDPDRVVMFHVRRLGNKGVQTSQPYVFHKFMRENVADFADVASATPTGVGHRTYYPVGRGASATRAAGAMVTANYFSLLGVRPAIGRFFTREEEPESGGEKLAVLGYGYWQREYGGSAQVIGRTIELGSQHYTIIGVTPRGFIGTDLRDVDIWLPVAGAPGLRFGGADWATTTSAQWMLVFARLKPGVSPEHAESEATAAYRNWARASLTKPTAERLARIDSESVVLGSIIPGKSLWKWTFSGSESDVRVAKLVGAVALIVLLIACANVANLLLVRALGRRREIAVRLALGVGRRRLVTQLVIEGLLLSGLGAIGALGVAALSSQIVRQWLIGDGAWTGGIISGRLLAFTAIVGMASGIVTSLVPALQASRPDLTPALKAGSREGSVQRSRTRAGLLGAQVALALVLLTGAGVFLKSLRNVGALDTGIDMSHVLTASISQGSAGLTNEQSLRLYQQFSERVRQIPGVKASAIAVGLPFSLSWGTRVSLPGREIPKIRSGPFQYAVTPGYFEALGIRVLSGRAFTDADRAGAPVVIVNSTLASLLWPGQNPVGSCLRVGEDSLPCATVVGVVSGTRRQDLVEDPVPQVYLSLEQLPPWRTASTVTFFGYVLVARTAGDAAAYVEQVRRTMQSVSSVVPYANVQTMHDLIGRQTRSWELGANVFSAFGALALVLASIGLFSVVAFTLGQRMHEFGVRRALGAQIGDLLALGVTRGLGPVIAGIGAGVAITLVGGRFVDSLLFQESPRDPEVLVTATCVLLVAALIASLAPARRAAAVDPTVALRSE